MKCPECGALYGTGDEFCPECGEQLKETKKESSKETEKKKSRWWLWAILAGCVIIIIIIFIMNAFTSSVQRVETYTPPVPTSYCGDGNCDSDEGCNTCPSDCGSCLPTTTTQQNQEEKTLTTEEIKSIVYQAIRKYVPESAISDYDVSYFPKNRCKEWWEYPQKTDDKEKYLIRAHIKVCQYDDAYTPEEMLSICIDCKPTEHYIKNLKNSKVLVRDSKDEYSFGGGSYVFGMEFSCQDKYYINILTQDFYGENVLPLYETYEIDKVAIENMVNEILSNC